MGNLSLSVSYGQVEGAAEVSLIKKLFCSCLARSFNISFISIIKINGHLLVNFYGNSQARYERLFMILIEVLFGGNLYQLDSSS